MVKRTSRWRCFYCKKRGRAVRLCEKCRHFVCGWEDCPGSPCPGNKRKKMLSQQEGQRRSFAFGNANMHDQSITREDIDRAAEKLAR